MSELRKRGAVAAVICSVPFMKLGQAQARTFGAPDLQLIQIPHPLGGLDLESVKGRAGVAVSQIVDLIKEQIK